MPYPDYLPYQRRKRSWFRVLLIVTIIAVALGLLLYQIPYVNRRVSWRLDIALTYIRMVLHPVSELPTPAVKIAADGQMQTPTQALPSATPQPTVTIAPTATPVYTPIPTLVPTIIPDRVQLTPPAYDEVRDRQDVNNCGPATLALYLRYFGWEGDQYDVSKIIKPEDDDRNVNVEELVQYVRTRSGWLKAEFRVGGDLNIIKKLIAGGIPVMIEETFKTDRKYWPEDDQWAGHYLLITGYDDADQVFTTHDSEIGPNQRFSYSDLDEHWQSFNRVYIMVYPPEMEESLKSILGENWDADTNRQNALTASERETEADPDNAYTWFNLGTNLVYFEKWNEAADAYDAARTIGLPQRMLRYQFGPFFAYFNSLQTEELMALTKYALEITRTSEEAMLWRGYGFYRQGDNSTALNFFRDALRIRPDYEDALYAIDFVNNN